MKEWMIRLGCVLLGVAITLGTTKLIDMVKGPSYEIEIQNQEPAKDEIEEVELPVAEEPAEEEPQQDYKLEAELKYQELLDSESVKAEREAVEEEVKEEYPANSIEAAPVKWIKDYPMLTEKSTQEEKEAIRSSYDETMAVNAFDNIIIDNSKIDFSDVKITIMGDSLTAGSNLSEAEKELYNWPAQLKEILGCKEVVNLGIGGSTVSRCMDSYPMCIRWPDIPADSDIIIVMGGSNDMLFEDKWMFGHIDYDLRMNKETFCGDLDDMLSRMEWTYRDHNENNYSKLIYINPPSTILNDAVYAINPENMVKQSQFAEAINIIAPEYQFEVIDFYNANILNSHDPDINALYVTDGIHCNKEGYKIMAEHVASQLIQRIEQ